MNSPISDGGSYVDFGYHGLERDSLGIHLLVNSQRSYRIGLSANLSTCILRMQVQDSAMEIMHRRIPESCEFMPDDYFTGFDPAQIFNNDGPIEVDLGCGDGSFLVAMAEHFPERNFLGVERLLGRVRKVSRKIERAGIENCKVLRLDSKYVIEYLLPTGSVDRLHLLCPDPWPKARHHGRRIVQEEFLESLYSVLKEGGEFCFKTDYLEYYQWVCEKIDRFKKFKQLEWKEDSLYYPKTDFQIQWEAEGRSMHQLRLQK